jgi:hypothetical protein
MRRSLPFAIIIAVVLTACIMLSHNGVPFLKPFDQPVPAATAEVTLAAPALATSTQSNMLLWSFGDWVLYLQERKQKKAIGMDRPTFVQVGANDGVRNDPLYSMRDKVDWKKWVGLMVEPGSFNNKQLHTLHADKMDWTFVKAVMAEKCVEGENITFYEYPQVVSASDFDKSPQLANSKFPKYIQIGQGNGLSHKHGLEPRKIPCINDMLKLIKDHGSKALLKYVMPNAIGTEDGCTLPTLDLLQIDCETHDWEIISSINFKAVVVHVIHFEGYGPVEKALRTLLPHAYSMVQDGADVLAINTKSVHGWTTGKNC